MSELIKTHCKQGSLVITETAIIVERLSVFDKSKALKSETMMRAAFVDLDTKKPAMMAAINLTFHGQGNKVLHADWVDQKDAQRIVALLTGRE